jgi:hypothetical protein
LTEEISEVESVVLEAPEPAVLQRIFRLKRKLIEFRRIAANTRDVVNELIRREQGLLGDDLDPYFRDVYDHATRTVELIETYRDLLTGSLDIYLSAVANRTNEVMKVLTVWGTVALPLVIITGFFGMNLHLPWSNNPHGALYACILMMISTVLILLVCYYDTRTHYYLRVTRDQVAGKVLGIVLSDDGVYREPAMADGAAGTPADSQPPMQISVNDWPRFHLRASIRDAALQFSASPDGKAWRDIGPVLDASKLSDDYGKALHFTGAMVGLCAQDLAGTGATADFDYFEIEARGAPS